jgi:hypothetical protein
MIKLNFLLAENFSSFFVSSNKLKQDGENMKITLRLLSLLTVFAAALPVSLPVSAATVEQTLPNSAIVGIDFAGTTAEAATSGDNTASNGNANIDGRTSDGLFSGVNANRHRLFFLQFDFSYYKNKLDALNSVKLRLFTNADSNNNASSRFEAYILTADIAAKINRTDIPTYGAARELGLISYSDNKIWEHTGLSPNTAYESGNFAAQIKQYFIDNPDATHVGIKAVGLSGYSLFLNSGNDAPFIKVELESEELSRIEEAMGDTSFDKLSSEDSKNITKSLTLPNTVNDGISVTWKSSDSRYLTDGGEIIRPAFGDSNKTVSLEGTFAYGGYDGKKTFNMTVLSDKESPLYKKRPNDGNPVTLTAIEAGFVRGGVSAERLMPSARLEGDSTTATSNNYRRVSFAKFDLSAHKSLFEQTEFIKLRLSPYNYLPLETGTNINGAPVNISVSLVDYDEWNSGDLTYKKANDGGMLTGGTELYATSGLLDMNGYYTADISGAIKEYFAQNPEKNNITLKIDSKSGTFAFHGLGASSDDLKPSLIAVNDKNATDAALAYLSFDRISGDGIDIVRKNLDFSKSAADLSAAGFDATTVAWSSSEPSVVNADTGAVTRAPNDRTVTLTAVITTGDFTETKEFEITVRGYEADAAYFRELLDGIAFESSLIGGNFSVPAEAGGFGVTWSSPDDYVISVSGGTANVSRLRSREIEIKLTASISLDGASASKDFYFTVLRRADTDILVKKKILDGGGTKAFAIDDDINTSWVPDGDRVMTIDLSGAKTVAEFFLIYDGAPLSGLTVEMYADKTFLKTESVYTSGSIQPGILNYLTLNSPVYAAYIRFICPDGISGVRFFSGYSQTAAENPKEEFWKLISIPSRVSADFSLPLSADGYGYNISWKSGDTSFIKIDGNTAKVTRGAVDRTVRLTGSIINYEAVTDGTQIEWSKDITVTGTGDGGGGVGRPGGGGGGGVTVSNGLTSQTPPAVTPDIPNEPFDDLNDAGWAKDYIVSLYEKGVIDGKGGGLFDPNGFTKREEMAKLLSVGLALENTRNDAGFKDVVFGDWYYGYVRDVYNSGLAEGIGDGLFGVGLNITRQDTAVLLARFLRSKGITAGTGGLDGFADGGDIAGYAKESVSMMKSLGIVGGDGAGNFNPSANITRAEICKLIYLVLDKIN